MSSGFTAGFVDCLNTFFKIDAGFNAAQHFIGCAKDSIKEMKLLSKQFQDTLISLIRVIQEVDDDNIKLLPVTMTAAYSLLDPLRIPG